MPSQIICDSCRRAVPGEPGHSGTLALDAPEPLRRHWPIGADGACSATLCASCILRVTMKLFGPSARAAPPPRLADLDDGTGESPVARGA